MCLGMTGITFVIFMVAMWMMEHFSVILHTFASNIDVMFTCHSFAASFVKKAFIVARRFRPGKSLPIPL